VLTCSVALEEVTEDPSPGLILGKQESLFLFFDRLVNNVQLSLESEHVAGDYAADADVPSANKEEHDVNGGDPVVELRGPPYPQIELVLSFEAPRTDLSEEHLGEVQEKVHKQVQILSLFETRRPEKKEELGEDAAAVHLQQLAVL
jgi:hypothetical protein